MRILLVEDEKILSKSIKMILERAEYEVDTAYDGEEALAYAKTAIYDLMILDVMMPKMDGWEVLKTISFGDLSLDLDSKDLSSGVHSMKLSKKEFDLMRMLLQGKNQVLSKEQILQKVWGYDSDAVENHVEVYIGFLRKKLRLLESNVSIQSRRGLGYFLAEQEESKEEHMEEHMEESQ